MVAVTTQYAANSARETCVTRLIVNMQCIHASSYKYLHERVRMCLYVCMYTHTGEYGQCEEQAEISKLEHALIGTIKCCRTDGLAVPRK